MNASSNINLADLVDKHTDEMFSWAFHKLSDKEMARDIVQDTFLAAAEKIDSFRGESTPKTWLFSILNYKIIDVYRKKVQMPIDTEGDDFSRFFAHDGGWHKEVEPLDWKDEEEHLLDNHEFNAVLEKCLDALPENWNYCVRSKYIFNKKGEDICQELGIASTNYWQIIHRAKVQLRNCIEMNWIKNNS